MCCTGIAEDLRVCTYGHSFLGEFHILTYIRSAVLTETNSTHGQTKIFSKNVKFSNSKHKQTLLHNAFLKRTDKPRKKYSKLLQGRNVIYTIYESIYFKKMTGIFIMNAN